MAVPEHEREGAAMTANPIDPHTSAWHLFGAVMRRCRDARPNLGLRQAATQMYTDFSNLAKWERGERTPPPDMISRLDQVYGGQGILTALYDVLVRLNAATESERLRAGRYAENPPYGIGDDDMERRAALQFLAGLGTLGTLGLSSEPFRQLLDHTFDHPHRDLAEWELACADHLHALRTRPPAQVAADLSIDLMAVRGQVQVSTPAEVTELQRITAVLASIYANALTRLGDHGAAIRWWYSARQAADASGDLALRLLVRGEEAGHGLYGQRDPETVLRMVHSTQQLAGQPTVDLLITEVKALSMLGRHDEALRMLATLHKTAEQGVTADRYGFWKPDQIHFAESWVYAAAGQEAAADTAREIVLKLARSDVYPINVQLHSALCTVTRGGVEEGLRHAAATIDALPPAYRGVRHIVETTKLVLRAVPRDQQTRPSVIEFRKLLAAAPPQNT
ncbi:helix-turn-helix transcriptional regulator [Sphaerisporangium sp. NPDC051011]|uniref:helix-turn-helix domain-containing protein n=1 Tax=Sphaerisporangium sp. NPDC051011 TaxID=3155792 RepID=UPI0033E4E9BE